MSENEKPEVAGLPSKSTGNSNQRGPIAHMRAHQWVDGVLPGNVQFVVSMSKKDADAAFASGKEFADITALFSQRDRCVDTKATSDGHVIKRDITSLFSSLATSIREDKNCELDRSEVETNLIWVLNSLKAGINPKAEFASLKAQLKHTKATAAVPVPAPAEGEEG